MVNYEFGGTKHISLKKRTSVILVTTDVVKHQNVWQKRQQQWSVCYVYECVFHPFSLTFL